MSDSQAIDQLLRQGIAAAKAGQKDIASAAFQRVIDLNHYHEQAWLWLSSVVDSWEDRRICLENVLEINPNNASARAGLNWLQQNSRPVQPVELCPHCQQPLASSGDQCPQCQQLLIVQ